MLKYYVKTTEALKHLRADLETVRRQIRETRSLTRRPFGVNLNLEFPQEERLAVCLDEGVPIISFFWRDPAALVRRRDEQCKYVACLEISNRDAEDTAYYRDSEVDLIASPPHARGKMTRKDGMPY